MDLTFDHEDDNNTVQPIKLAKPSCVATPTASDALFNCTDYTTCHDTARTTKDPNYAPMTMEKMMVVKMVEMADAAYKVYNGTSINAKAASDKHVMNPTKMNVEIIKTTS